MKSRLLVFAFVLLAIAPLRAQSADPLETEVTETLKGKIITLRHFYSAGSLHYNADGELVGSSDAGPWTLTGRLQVEKVTVKEDHVQLEGKRAWVRFKDRTLDTQVNGITPISIFIKMDLVQGPDRVARWRSALPKVIFTKSTPLWEDAPIYWRDFLGGPKPGKPSTPGGDEQQAVAKIPMRVRISQGVSEGMILHKEIPQYPPEAREAHLQGFVVLHAVIGKDGHLQDLQVLNPVGMGLEDAAAVAVSKWTYRPHSLQGNPVEVDTQITVNFELRR